MFSDADAAALYDLLNPWNPELSPGDRFYDELVMAAASVLDVGCGTGAMLAYAREHGHAGRLTGLDPDPASLARARRRTDIEWVEGAAADAGWAAEFDLAIMTGHAFQCLVIDEDLSASLAAVHAALRPGGRFVFETRHPQARAWEGWNPSNEHHVVDASGRSLRVWHEVDSVVGDVVTFTGTTARPDGTVLRLDRSILRFLDAHALDAFLAGAGFETEARYGDWHRGAVTATSREIVTVARRAR
ncbi:methyltransferase domain-containing protein [Streptomyces sp. NBC_01537]|uniref:class I SAM-dependent methyltransferase n=1 Tax=Streptomyces sp. NBC_01537 TaxID=2903896 RepID=UPI00386FE350